MPQKSKHRAELGWPERQLVGGSRSYHLDNYYCAHERAQRADEQSQRRSLYRPDSRWLFDYILPPFQRPVVWDEARMIRLVESAICGIAIGTIVYNDSSRLPLVNGFFHPTDRWLIDGQQRLTAFERYFNDAFPVFGTRWSEVPEIARRDLLHNTPLPAIVTSITDEQELRELYNRLNFGGVAHTEDQRA